MEAEVERDKECILDKRLSIDIIIPTLNEEESIMQTIRSIKRCELPVEIRIFVIDGGSTDRTAEICSTADVRFIVQNGKGKGNAMRQAVGQSNADLVAFIDGDGTYLASDLSQIIEPLVKKEADVVVGSRFLGQREDGSIPPLNTFGNKIFNRAINFSLNSHVTDSLSGLRSMYRNVFNDLILFSDTFEIEIEMTVEALAKGYRVLEVPISYKTRQVKSKSKLVPTSDGSRIARTLLLILISVNPLKFFGIISLALFTIALWPTTQVIYEKITLGEIVSIPAAVLAALLFISSGLSTAMGIMSELIVRSRRRIEMMMNRKERI